MYASLSLFCVCVCLIEWFFFRDVRFWAHTLNEYPFWEWTPVITKKNTLIERHKHTHKSIRTRAHLYVCTQMHDRKRHITNNNLMYTNNTPNASQPASQFSHTVTPNPQTEFNYACQLSNLLSAHAKCIWISCKMEIHISNMCANMDSTHRIRIHALHVVYQLFNYNRMCTSARRFMFSYIYSQSLFVWMKKTRCQFLNWD